MVAGGRYRPLIVLLVINFICLTYFYFYDVTSISKWSNSMPRLASELPLNENNDLGEETVPEHIMEQHEEDGSEQVDVIEMLDNSEKKSQKVKPCNLCEYMKKDLKTDKRSMIMTSTIGTGRTGNYFLAMWKAIKRAHMCKTTLTLPLEDKRGDVLYPTSDTNKFDFRDRKGPMHPACDKPNNGPGIVSSARLFANLPGMPRDNEFGRSYDLQAFTLAGCLRWYMGLCREDYCDEIPDLSNSLVAHVRQGDIFKANFDVTVNKRYGQPPVSYYLRAMTHRSWDKILVLSENDTINASPIYLALKQLNQNGMFGTRMKFQSTSWPHDFKTLMCAPNLVESFSTLYSVLNLGFAENIYSFAGCDFSISTDPLFENKQIWSINVGEYEPFKRHDNSPKEWVDILLHEADEPVQCKTQKIPGLEDETAAPESEDPAAEKASESENPVTQEAPESEDPVVENKE
jgi:hypothetical protein